MLKSNSHNCKKAISKALENLSTDKQLTISAAAHIYALLLSIFIYHFHRQQNQALKHAAY